MKLEIKHLAGYLPYGLQIYFESLDREDKYAWTLNYNEIDFLLRNKNKPILHPLSDLTKEIDNGLTYNDLIRSEFDKNGVNGFDFYYLQETPLAYPFEIIQKLLEWHFDIYGLIDAGLAIDINTIK